MKNDSLRIFIYLIVLFLVANLVLFAMGYISEILFWAIIIAAAVFAYIILPKMKKQN